METAFRFVRQSLLPNSCTSWKFLLWLLIFFWWHLLSEMVMPILRMNHQQSWVSFHWLPTIPLPNAPKRRRTLSQQHNAYMTYIFLNYLYHTYFKVAFYRQNSTILDCGSVLFLFLFFFSSHPTAFFLFGITKIKILMLSQ